LHQWLNWRAKSRRRAGGGNVAGFAEATRERLGNAALSRSDPWPSSAGSATEQIGHSEIERAIGEPSQRDAIGDPFANEIESPILCSDGTPSKRDALEAEQIPEKCANNLDQD
jgi:hypothetical protein